MKPGEIPSAERLRPAEKVAHAARIMVDGAIRVLPCLGYLPPSETSYHQVRKEIDMLENIANDEWEHHQGT